MVGSVGRNRLAPWQVSDHLVESATRVVELIGRRHHADLLAHDLENPDRWPGEQHDTIEIARAIRHREPTHDDGAFAMPRSDHAGDSHVARRELGTHGVERGGGDHEPAIPGSHVRRQFGVRRDTAGAGTELREPVHRVSAR